MNTKYRAKAYIKEKCPFSFKFLVFMAEAGLLNRIEIVRLNPRDPGFEATKKMLGEHLGKAATFPVVEVEPNAYMADSDALIERYAAEAHFEADAMPVLSFYKESILPQLMELFQIKHPKAAPSL